jgi:methylthioribose-1-phosphate isomerase
LRVFGQPHVTIDLGPDSQSVIVIDQTLLPGSFEKKSLRTVAEAADAIRSMVVRGAPLIGVTAAFGVWLALRDDPSDAALGAALELLGATRPTAVNLAWALTRARRELLDVAPPVRARAALALALRMANEDAAACEAIGRHGAALLRRRFEELGSPETFHVLTHCNAGWLATVDWGTALAPVYRLHDEGVPTHVWVDETRPRNQGLLTQWELAQHGVPCTLIVDNAGGLLMQRGQVHACIVGADRIAANGDVCNKVGTYLKALAARDAGVPFYVAAPTSTFDLGVASGGSIPIEERSPREITPDASIGAYNPAFDVTPCRLVDAIVTERGICAAHTDSIERHLKPS